MVRAIAQADWRGGSSCVCHCLGVILDWPCPWDPQISPLSCSAPAAALSKSDAQQMCLAAGMAAASPGLGGPWPMLIWTILRSAGCSGFAYLAAPPIPLAIVVWIHCLYPAFLMVAASLLAA